MGAPAQQNSAVFYDQEQGQYYTVNPPQTNDSMGNMLYGNPLSRAMFNLTGGSSNNQNRNYLGNPYANNADRFTPKTITPQYPEMNMLVPALNAGLLQGIASSTQPDGAMSGAGRFLSPQTNNTQGK